MKGGGLALMIVGGVFLAISLFFGIFSMKNFGSAERLQSSIGPRGGGFVVRLVEAKARGQMNISIGTGIPGVLMVAGGFLMRKKAA